MGMRHEMRVAPQNSSSMLSLDGKSRVVAPRDFLLDYSITRSMKPLQGMRHEMRVAPRHEMRVAPWHGRSAELSSLLLLVYEKQSHIYSEVMAVIASLSKVNENLSAHCAISEDAETEGKGSKEE